jgi:septal ring factor EnvC (AmiA/AmiB activator)
MARLTKEQRAAAERVVAYADPPESHFAEWILRLDEEVEPVHPSHLTTVVEHLERERDEALARLASAERALSALRLAYSREADALASALDERDEARSTLDAMSVSLRDRLAEAERERDEARRGEMG